MKMRQKILILLTLLLCEITMNMLYSQTIKLNDSYGTQTTYSLKTIKKLTFDDGNFRIYFADNTVNDLLLNNLVSITFSDFSSGLYLTDFSSMKNLFVYPNPVHDILYIKLPDSDTDLNGKILIESIDGRMLFTAHCNSMKKSINLSTLPTGIYVCNYISKNGTQKVKIIKN